jgi:hypothetical protein
MALYLYRLEGASLLNGGVYESIETDRTATWQSTVTVILSSAATGLAGAVRFGWDPRTMLALTGIALVTWVAWASLIFHIGTRMMPGPETRTNLGELLRTTGFAAAPGMLQALATVWPSAAVPIFAATGLWMFAAMVVAVKHALDYRSTTRAIAVCLVAAGLCLALAVSLALLFTRVAASIRI